MEILLDSIILIFLALSLLLFIGLLITIFASNAPILLTFNTYLTLFLTLMLIIYVYNLYGDLYPLMSITSLFCEFFSRSKYLQSHVVFTNAILLILFNFFNGDYQYLPQQYRCRISFENIRGLLLAVTIIYICPLVTILLIYIYIVRYVRQSSPMQQRQQKAIDRDVLVLKRITIFVLVITLIGLPTISILFIRIISSKLIPMAYHIQGLSKIFIATICFALITP